MITHPEIDVRYLQVSIFRSFHWSTNTAKALTGSGFQRSRFEALKSAAADHWSKMQLKWNQNSSATSTSKCSKCFNLQDVLALEDACIEVVALADFFYTSKLKLSEGLKPKHFQMRESATEVTWSNGEISAFVDFSRPRLPAGCTSKASLRLHRHTLCTTRPHQGHRWSLLYSRTYPYISYTSLRHVSSSLAFLYRLNSIGSSTSSWKHKGVEGVGWTLKFLHSDLLIPTKCLCKYSNSCIIWYVKIICMRELRASKQFNFL